MRLRSPSLSVKILGAFVAAFAGVALIAGALQYRSVRNQMYDAVEESASNMARTLEALLIENPALMGSTALERSIQRFATSLPDVDAVSIVDPELRVIGNSDPRLLGTRAESAGLAPLLAVPGERSFYYDRDGRRYFRLIHSLAGRYDEKRKSAVPALLVIDMHISHVDERIMRSILGDMTSVLLLLALVGLPFYWYARQSFVSPLVKLASAAESFGVTGHAEPVEIRSGDELETLARAFNRSVRERQKSEQLLRDASDASEAANRAKSEFLANMSHEIRTPMNGVLGMLELALDTELSPDQRDYVATARSSAEALIDIINDILDFSKIEAHRLELDPSRFRLGESLSDTVSTLGLRADQKGLEFTLDISADVPDALVGDVGRLRQVIVNLVGNAVKFTEQGEVLLHIGVERRLEKSVVLRFTVTDTGIGIDPEQQPRVFEAFHQGDSSTTRRFGGTGLGLTISSRLVSLMGGQIDLTSTPGTGSAFSFTADFDLQPDQTAVGEVLPEARLAGLSVLVVDDNATNRRILDGMLRGWGMKPGLASSSEEALTLLRDAHDVNSPFSLLITDSHMPGMDGFELVEMVRQMLHESCPTILMLSSAARAHDDDRSRELGISLYLTKPVRRAALSRAIRSALAENHELESAPTPARESVVASGGLKVLIAEDNAVNQKLSASIIQRAGHIPTVVGNGLEAILAVEQQRFDVVLMDVQMPVMGGFEATRRIRELESVKGWRTPIIAVTARVMKGDREECLAAGMDGFVSKPIHSKQLLALIEELVRGTPSTPPVETDDKEAAMVLDEAKLLSIVHGDRKLAGELAALFLEDIEPRLAEIRAAVYSGNAVRLTSAAHTIRGSAASLTAVQVAVGAQTLETMARSGEMDGTEGVLTDLEASLDQLRPRLIALSEPG